MTLLKVSMPLWVFLRSLYFLHKQIDKAFKYRIHSICALKYCTRCARRCIKNTQTLVQLCNIYLVYMCVRSASVVLLIRTWPTLVELPASTKRFTRNSIRTHKHTQKRHSLTYSVEIPGRSFFCCMLASVSTTTHASGTQ